MYWTLDQRTESTMGNLLRKNGEAVAFCATSGILSWSWRLSAREERGQWEGIFKRGKAWLWCHGVRFKSVFGRAQILLPRSRTLSIAVRATVPASKCVITNCVQARHGRMPRDRWKSMSRTTALK